MREFFDHGGKGEKAFRRRPSDEAEGGRALGRDMRYFNFQIPPEFRPLDACYSMLYGMVQSALPSYLPIHPNVLLLGDRGTEKLKIRIKRSKVQAGVPANPSLGMDWTQQADRPTAAGHGPSRGYV